MSSDYDYAADSYAEEIATLRTEAERLRCALRPFVDNAHHTRVFLVSREKMHPDGVALYDQDVNRARAALRL